MVSSVLSFAHCEMPTLQRNSMEFLLCTSLLKASFVMVHVNDLAQGFKLRSALCISDGLYSISPCLCHWVMNCRPYAFLTALFIDSFGFLADPICTDSLLDTVTRTLDKST